MKKSVLAILQIVGFLVASGVVFILVALVITRFSTLPAGPLVVDATGELPAAGSQLTLLSWNLGYGGLGADADFVADGGKSVLPTSPATVVAHLAGFQQVLMANPADVVLLQEVTTGSLLNYSTNVLAAVEAAIPQHAAAYSVDLASALLPPPLKVVHGKAIISRIAMSDATRVALPLEDDFILGVLRNNYSVVVARFPIAGSTRSWVVLNLHLAAFDAGGLVRKRQLQTVLALAQEEHASGNPVVIGGDFNMEFVRDTFPSTEDPSHRFWITAFPNELLPDGWTVARGENAPSVRTLAAPYRAGVTYTTVVDGFILSPGVSATNSYVIDTAFAYSDHQPSFVVLSAGE